LRIKQKQKFLQNITTIEKSNDNKAHLSHVFPIVNYQQISQHRHLNVSNTPLRNDHALKYFPNLKYPSSLLGNATNHQHYYFSTANKKKEVKKNSNPYKYEKPKILSKSKQKLHRLERLTYNILSSTKTTKMKNKKMGRETSIETPKGNFYDMHQIEECMKYHAQRQSHNLSLTQALFHHFLMDSNENAPSPSMYLYLLESYLNVPVTNEINDLSKWEATIKATGILCHFLTQQNVYGNVESFTNELTKNLPSYSFPSFKPQIPPKQQRLLKTYHFKHLIKAWSSTISNNDNNDHFNIDPTKKAEILLSLLLNLFETSQRSDLQPTSNVFAALIQAICQKSLHDSNAALLTRAEAILRQMIANYEQLNLSEGTQIENQALLDKNDKSENCMPNSHAFNMLLMGYAKHGDLSNFKRIMKWMEEIQIPLDVRSYAAWMEAYIHLPTFQYFTKMSDQNYIGQKVESILYEFERQQQIASSKSEVSNAVTVHPDTNSITVLYNTVLKAWSLSKNPKRVEEIFYDMIQNYQKGKNEDVVPDVISLNTVLTSWARKGEAKRAHDILQKFISPPITSLWSIKPNTMSYNIVIQAFAQSRGKIIPNSSQFVVDLLESMKSLSEKDENCICKPDIITYNTVLSAFARNGNESKDHQKQGAQRAQLILKQLLEEGRKQNVYPDIITYNSIMKVWSQASSPVKAESILQFLESNYQHNLMKKRDHLESDAMQQSKLVVKPNIISFLTVIKAFADQGDCDNAQRIYNQMVSLWRKGNEDSSIERSDLAPNTVLVNALIHAYAKASSKKRNAAHKAQHLLEEMIIGHERTKNDGEIGSKNTLTLGIPLADAISFCSAINAWAHSMDPNKAQYALNVLQKMKQYFQYESLTPKEMRIFQNAYNTTIHACTDPSSASSSLQSLKIALDLMEELNQNYQHRNHPDAGLGTVSNSKTYGNFFNVCNRLVEYGNDRDDIVREYFQQCCDNGLVDEFALSRFRTVASRKLLMLIFEGLVDNEKNIDITQVPSHWSRNLNTNEET